MEAAEEAEPGPAVGARCVLPLCLETRLVSGRDSRRERLWLSAGLDAEAEFPPCVHLGSKDGMVKVACNFPGKLPRADCTAEH